MRRRRFLSTLIPLTLFLALLAACRGPGPGPQAVVVERGAFNEAIQRTNAEQLLLNIVRLRYVDPPLFLELSSIASQVEVQFAGSLGGRLNEAANDALDLGTSITTTRAPTVSYTPLQGEQFVRQLLTPLDVRTIVLLYHTGWSVDRLLRLTVQALGRVRNAPRASGPTPDTPPEYSEFRELTAALRELQLESRLDIGEATGESGNQVGMVLAIAPPRSATPPAVDGSTPVERLFELLEYDSTSDRVVLETALVRGSEKAAIVPRSLLGILFYAAQGVDVPEADRQAGRVTITRTASGEEFDWTLVMGDLFDVRVSKRAPDSAYVRVFYRDHWFWIADDDLQSKATFALLDQLFALQAGSNRAAQSPVLTIPIGG